MLGGKRVKLDIGSGDHPYDPVRYISVDAFNDKAEVKAEMWDLPYKDGEIDEIYASHCLEHAAIAKVPETLKEWHRVLKPAGRCIIQVPNMDYIAKYWLTGPDRPWAEAMLFGLQTHDGEFHKSAFTAAIIKADCEAAGFEVKRVEVRWNYNQETLQCVCVKPTEIKV